ncbi:hypothetical protein [Actinoplanes sp. NPDC020271]|uniref:hypothetical protein n=1 Tax=Actinoplanes sp. NPDC020271 TaxID=3363896 RepID=UPI0037BC5B83
MSDRRKATRRVMALILVAIVALGVVAIKDHFDEGLSPILYDRAAKSLPVVQALAREHVTFLRAGDGCQVYADDREKRASQLSSTCTREAGYQLFDDASRAHFAQLRAALKDLPYDVDQVTITYGAGGTLDEAQLAIDTVNPYRLDSIIYHPGYTLPQAKPGELEFQRIDADWYYMWEDWN